MGLGSPSDILAPCWVIPPPLSPTNQSGMQNTLYTVLIKSNIHNCWSLSLIEVHFFLSNDSCKAALFNGGNVLTQHCQLLTVFKGVCRLGLHPIPISRK